MIRRISSANSVPEPINISSSSQRQTMAFLLSDHPLVDEIPSDAPRNSQRVPATSSSNHSRNPSITTQNHSISSGLNVYLESNLSNSSGDLENGGNIKNSSPSNVSVPSYMSTSPQLNSLIDLPCVFLRPPSDQLVCALCSKVFFDPVISQCGHTFCRRCIEDSCETLSCPNDGSTLAVVTSNLAVSEQVSELEIHCRYGLTESEVVDPDGCKEVIKLRNRLSHERNCEFEMVPCTNNPNCPRIRKMNLDAHLAQCLNRQCPNSVYTCSFVGTLDMIHHHLETECKFQPLKDYLAQNCKETEQIREIIQEKDNEICSLKSEVSKLNDSLRRLETRCGSKVKSLEENHLGSIQQINELRRNMKSLNDEVTLINAKLSTGVLGPYDPHHQYKCRGTFVGHQSDIWCLITCGDILITGSSDKTIKVWDKCSSFKCLQSLEGHTSQVLSLHSCGKFLYSGSADGLIIIWDLDTFEQLKVLYSSEYGIGAIATGNGMLFVGSQNFIGVYNFSDPWETRTKISMPPITAQWVKALKTNEKHLFCGTSGQIKVYDLTKEEVPCVRTLSTQFGYIYSLDLSSELLVAGCQNGKVLIYDPTTFEAKGTLEGHVSTVHSVAILQVPGNTRVFSASQDRSIRVWSLERMICVQNLIRHIGAVTCITVSRGLIFSGSCDASVKVWQ